MEDDSLQNKIIHNHDDLTLTQIRENSIRYYFSITT